MSEQSEVQNVADRPMRRSALEEERRNSRHMNLELSMRADELRFGDVDKNAEKNSGPRWNAFKPKPNEPAQGGFVSRNPVDPVREESHQSSQWGSESSRVERPMQSLCHKSLFVGINPKVSGLLEIFIDQDQTATSCG